MTIGEPEKAEATRGIEENRENDREALYRFLVISPLINERHAQGDFKKQLEAVAAKFHEHPTHGFVKIAAKTIEGWFYRYRRTGFPGLVKNRRKDSGVIRAIGGETGSLIVRMKRENPRRSARQIVKELVMSGRIAKGEFSLSAVYRLLKLYAHDLAALKDTHEKRKFEFMFSNECWQGDVCHGPYLRFAEGEMDGRDRKRKIFLFAFIDDASRIIPHAEFTFHEDLAHFLEFMKIAFQKKGIPNCLYLDNAGYFRSPVVQTIGARLGMRVLYCTPYSPYKKGKIERFMRTIQGQFIHLIDREKTYTLADLNLLLSRWIETDYHHAVHSSLGGPPLEAWQAKSRNLRYPDRENIEKDFLAEETRLVRKDGTILVKSRYFEVCSTLAGRNVTVRFDPFHLAKALVYIDGKFFRECRPVNTFDNRFIVRRKIEIERRGEAGKDDATGLNYIEMLRDRIERGEQDGEENGETGRGDDGGKNGERERTGGGEGDEGAGV